MNALPLDKNGQPYTPMTEAEMRAARNRPFPEDFMRLSEMIGRRRAQIAAEGPRVYYTPVERTVVTEPIGKAIARKTKITRRRKR